MRPWTHASMALALAVVALTPASGCSSSGDSAATQASASGSSGASGRAGSPADPRRYCKHPAGYKLLRPSPGRIVAHLGSLWPPNAMARVVNGWAVGTPRADVHVQAGAADEQGETGALAVSRFVACSPSNQPKHGKAVDLVELPGSGPLHVTAAPLGSAATHRPGSGVQVAFASANGTKGVLHLREDSVSFAPSSTVQNVAAPRKCAEVPPHALTVTATAIDCASAQAFVASSYHPCFSEGDCNFQGFTCKASPIGGGLVSMSCQDGARRIEWTWHN